MTGREQTRRDAEARERLTKWLDGFTIGKAHEPTYTTLAGLRSDVRALLAELRQAERVVAELLDLAESHSLDASAGDDDFQIIVRARQLVRVEKYVKGTL